MTEAAINGDLTRRVHVDTTAMPWSPSPSPKVWRKRMHRVGPPESGQVTSIVRYDADSDFPAHEHPDGEEILVLEGVFTDDRGDWPQGAYLLNPEGYRHAPSSRLGCVIFVKLRQYPGRDRNHVAIDTEALAWQQSELSGIEIKPLYTQAGFADSVSLERWSAGTGPVRRKYPDGVEYFVLDGQFGDEAGTYGAGTWLRLPPGAEHAPYSSDGCRLYIKQGAFRYLRSADDSGGAAARTSGL